MTTFDKVRNLIDCAAEHAKTWQGRSAAESITLATGYAEPGYDEPESGVILRSAHPPLIIPEFPLVPS